MKISDLVEGLSRRTKQKRLSAVGQPGKKGKVYHYEYEDAVVPFQVQQVFHVGGTVGGAHSSKSGKRSRIATGAGLVGAIVDRLSETDDHREVRKLEQQHRYHPHPSEAVQARLRLLYARIRDGYEKRDEVYKTVAEDLINAGIVEREDLWYELGHEDDY